MQQKREKDFFNISDQTSFLKKREDFAVSLRKQRTRRVVQEKRRIIMDRSRVA